MFKSEILQKKSGANRAPEVLKRSSENMNSTSIRNTFPKSLREKLEINNE